MSNLKVGVVGVGHIGREHARIYSQLPGVEFVGVYDLDGQVAEKVAQRHGVKAFPTAQALAEEVDAATIATPTSTHHEIGRVVSRPRQACPGRKTDHRQHRTGQVAGRSRPRQKTRPAGRAHRALQSGAQGAGGKADAAPLSSRRTGSRPIPDAAPTSAWCST
jgi:hypothetical protein